MKLVSVLTAKVIRLLPVTIQEGKVVNAAALARALEARYGFLQGPRTVEEYDMTKGVVFQRGVFDDKPTIDRFTVYNDGVVCDVRVDSGIADAFLDDVIAWAREHHSLVEAPPEAPRRGYLSSIDVQMDVDLGDAFPGFEKLCQRISAAIRSYGQHAPDFKPAMFGFNGDVTTPAGNSGPPGFWLERREGEPYSSRRYFARAALTTADHVDMLGELEQLLLSMPNA